MRLANALLGWHVLNTHSFEMMTSPQKPSADGGVEHGLGLEIGADGAELYHGGTSVGASSYLYIQPEQRVVVALLTNLTLWTKPRHEMAQRLAEIVINSD